MLRRYTGFLVFCLSAAVFGLACKKTETVIRELQTPESKFSVSVRDPYLGMLAGRTTNLVDSNFYFRNLSDTAQDVQFQWDFGDGSVSTLRDPVHRYAAAGNYRVRLTASRGERAVHTSDTLLSVILGERGFAAGQGVSSPGVDVLVRADGSFVLLGSTSFWQGSTSVERYFLMNIDADLKRKALKEYDAGVRMNALAECSDGSLVATGTWSGHLVNNELIKLGADGSKAWSRVFGSGDDFRQVVQTPDGGFVLTGSRGVKNQVGNILYNTLVVKLSSSGDVQWERYFASGLVLNGAAGVMAEADGYVLAANKKRDRQPYCNCDSIAVVKLNLSGATLWKRSVQWALNVENVSLVHGAKIKNGNYQFIPAGSSGLFVFSPEGEFLERRISEDQNHFASSTDLGELVVMGTDYGNGFRAVVSGYTDMGVFKWRYNPSGMVPIAGGYQCCADSWPVVVRPLKDGGSIALFNLVMPTTHDYVPVLVKLDRFGKPL